MDDVDWGLVVQVLAALGTMAAAFAAFWSAHESQRATQAQLITSIIDRFDSPSMQRSIRVFTAFRNGCANSVEYNKRRRVERSVVIDGEELQDHGGRVVSHFRQVHKLATARLLGRKHLRVVVTQDQAYVFLHLAKPLDTIDPKLIAFYEELYGPDVQPTSEERRRARTDDDRGTPGQ